MSDNAAYAPAMHDDGYGAYPPARRSLVMSSGSSRRMIVPRHQPQQYIDEQEEYASDGCDDEGEGEGEGEGPGTIDDGEFEMVGAGRHRLSRRANHHHHHHPPRRRVEITKFRIKVHAAHDTRYIIVGPAVQLGEFEDRIRDKFGISSGLKIKMRDDGDMVTMVDQEDLDLLLMAAREFARREGSELGKMEVSSDPGFDCGIAG